MDKAFSNRNIRTLCGSCFTVLKWIPVLLIIIVISWSYYAYVVEICLRKMQNCIQVTFLLFFYHIILVLLLWSYWRTIFTPIGRIPDRWRLPQVELDRLSRAQNPELRKHILNTFAKDLPVTKRFWNGSVRFCEICKIIKPDRAEHCIICKRCVLKMDHHCLWLNNCVNFYNNKFFVLFLGYSIIYFLYIGVTTLGDDSFLFWKSQLGGTGIGRLPTLFLLIITYMFATWCYHMCLVLINRTTLEAFQAPVFRNGGPNRSGYNMGRYGNFCEVFGVNWILWLIPIFSSKGDGLTYPMAVEHAMGNAATNLLDVEPKDNSIDVMMSNTQPKQPHQPCQSTREALEQQSTKVSIRSVDIIPPSPAAATTNGVLMDIIGDQLEL